MILRRLRARVPLLCAYGLLALAGTVLATTPVMQSQMEAFVYRTMAGVISTALLIGAGVIAWLLARDRDINGKRFDDLSADVREALAVFKSHNADALAHPAAFERHGEKYVAQLDRMEMMAGQTKVELHDLKRDHDRINEACALRRSPEDSPYPKRASDRDAIDPTTGEPFVRLRGRQ